MRPSTALTDPSAPLVADSSTVINLVATGTAAELISALPNRIVVVDVVPAELETGRPLGHRACDGLKELIDAKLIDVVTLDDDEGMELFERLVVGPAVETLDDGEAATIAYAVTRGATALIDERKAMRICHERFSSLRVACTMDVLLHEGVHEKLGTDKVADAVYNALRGAHMGVATRHMDWVVQIIGPERVAQCQSLPLRLRPTPKGTPSG
jgi:predicted nucleic acid-binding protein